MHRTEPPTKEHPHGRIFVTVAVAAGPEGYVIACPVCHASEYTDTEAKALESVRRPMNFATGLVTGWIPRLSDREQWDLRTPACDKRHTKNPFD